MASLPEPVDLVIVSIRRNPSQSAGGLLLGNKNSYSSFGFKEQEKEA